MSPSDDSPDSATPAKALEVVLFLAGRWRVGIEARHVRATRSLAAGELDSGQGWIEDLLGLPRGDAGAPRQCLMLKGQHGTGGTDGPDDSATDRAVFVGSPIELVSLPAEKIYPLPPLLTARTRLHGFQALALLRPRGPVTLLFDAQKIS